MLSRPLFVAVAGLGAVGALLAPSSAPASTAAPASLDRRAGEFRALVSAPVGGDWSVRFTDGRGTVVASVADDAIALLTAAGRVPATHVIAVDGDVVELGTDDPALTATVAVTPAGSGTFGVDVDGHGVGITGVSLDLRAGSGERYLGLGERSDVVDHRGRQVENRVLDGPYTPTQQELIKPFLPASGFSTRTDATYFPVPWVLSTSGYGVLVDNDEDSSFELATPEHRGVNRFAVESDHLDLRVFDGPTPARALARMTAAIGRQPAPSTPAVLGAWFQPRGDAVAAIADQRERGVAVSVAQTYVHYLPCGDQDPDREKALTAGLHEHGVSVTTYFNPMVCTDHQPAYDRGLDAGAFTMNPDGTPLVYPYSTASHFVVSQVDFSGEAGRDYYQSLLQEAVDHGYDGWMEDFGEYTPDTAVSDDGTPGPTMHNRYVEQYHGTAREFETGAPRPLLRFQRSGWTGAIKDSSIVWGGDPTTAWGFDGLESSVRQGLTMGASGVSVWGPDIGGFFTLPNDPSLTPELLKRWIEYGAFTGVMRLQSGGITFGTTTPKPQVTDPDIAPVWKKYTRLRTMLYPYVAGSQDEYQRSGLPLMRHLALVEPGAPKAVRTHDEYLFGQDLLVAPVTTWMTTSRKVYLPRGRWLELARSWDLEATGAFRLTRAQVLRGRQTVTAKAPTGTIPLFLRVGSVVPMLPRTVDTLSEYGTDLADAADRRTLLAAPSAGPWRGPLGPGETMRSTGTGRTWTLTLDATQARTYDVRATLAGLGSGWVPCRVEADGERVAFSFEPGRQVVRVRAPLAADGALRVTACHDASTASASSSTSGVLPASAVMPNVSVSR